MIAAPPSGAEQDPLDRIVVALVRHEVDFIAIGGWAGAWNSVDEWGASDHCRLLIDVGDDNREPARESERQTQGS